MYRLLSPADLGRVNKARVINTLQLRGPKSRAALAQELGISRGTVSTVVNTLIEAGLLIEQTGTASSGGKPPKPLWFSPAVHLGAILVTAHEVIIARVGLDGVVQRQIRAPFHSRGSFFAGLDDGAARLFGDGHLIGVGIASAGAVDTDRGAIRENYLDPDLNDLNLVDHVTSTWHVPAYIDHHPRVQAIGDRWQGKGHGRDYFASVFVGETLGVGVVAEGELIAGHRGAGGEVGHMVVNEGGEQCVCGQRGCWVTMASIGWLSDQAEQLGLVAQSRPGHVSVASLSESGDSAAQQLLNRYAANLGLGLANLEQLFGCGRYILHGEAALLGNSFAARVAAEVRRRIPRAADSITVLCADIPDEATIQGAAGMALLRTYDARLH